MQKTKATFLITFLSIIVVMAFSSCTDKKQLPESTQFVKLLEKTRNTSTDAPEYPALLDSLEKSANRTKDLELMVDALSIRGEYLNTKEKFPEAILVFKKSISLAEELGLSLHLGKDLENIGKSYYKLKDHTNALSSFKRSATIREETGDSVGLGSSLNNTGFVYWMQTEFDSALIYFNKALEIRSKLPNTDHHATTLNNLGTIYFNWAIYDKSLEYYMKSLSLQREIKNDYGIAISLTNIGLVYNETGQHEEAIQYYKESLPHAVDSKDTNVVGYVYQGLGYAFEDIDVDSSIYYFKLSLAKYQSASYPPGIILALRGIGDFYFKLKDYEVAGRNFEEMYQLAVRERIQLREAEALKGLGEVFLAQNLVNKAKSYLEESQSIGARLGNKVLLRDVSELKSEIFERLGDKDSALITLRIHLKYAQEIQGEEMSRRLIGLKNKFQFEKFELDLQKQMYENRTQRITIIATAIMLILVILVVILLYRVNKRIKNTNRLLNQQNELIEGQAKELGVINQQLVESNDAKDKLFSIISHDLRSPFQELLGITGILKEDFYELTNDEKLHLIVGLEETSRKTFELLENLLNLSASRMGKLSFDPVEVDVSEIVKKTLSLHSEQAIGKKISLKSNVRGGQYISCDPNMLEIVFRNLLSNAIKYTHEEGEITVDSCDSDGFVCFSIKDNGIGMDNETKANIFNINAVRSQRGTRGEKGTGLGIGLCKEFIEKHNGLIEIESEPGVGTTFRITLPKNGGVKPE
ncbi:MAG: tetratricopeptide repeat-containing sensor histidine kinase [Ignavibacteriaceae bacterium]|nr:tetratricopeptide repeat-containing sensor histidine kinase [Ignavibacteriaceae bacterium]